MKIAYLAVGALLEAFDEEPYQSLEDEDNGQNEKNRWQLVLEEDDKFLSQVVTDNAQHTFVLRGRGQKEHD
jgi:hypothetical protein